MDSEILMTLGLGPFYAMAVWGCWWGMNFSMHKLQKLDQSAQETQLSETTSPPSQALPQVK